MRLRAMALGAVAVLGVACGADRGGDDGRTFTVYSGRTETFIRPILERFQQDTSIQLEIRYGDSAELATSILEEGDASPADAFIAQDAGSLGSLAGEERLLELPEDLVERVDPRFRSPDGEWVGISGRARVAVYNTERVSPADLPDSVHGFTEPGWRGRIGVPPTNASFQAFVAAMILTEGEDAARTWLEGFVANEPVLFESNGAATLAVARGEVDVALVNHYYKFEVEAEEGRELPIENHFFTGGDAGALVNTAGIAVLRTSDDTSGALRLVDFLTGPRGQRFFTNKTWEYPVVPGHAPGEELVALEEIESPEIDLSDLAGTLKPAVRMLADVGLV